MNESGAIAGMMTKSGGVGGWIGAVWTERANSPGRFHRVYLPLHPLGGLNGWTEGLQILDDGRVLGRSNLYFNGDHATLWSNDAAHTPVLLEPLENSIQSMPGDDSRANVALAQPWPSPVRAARA